MIDKLIFHCVRLLLMICLGSQAFGLMAAVPLDRIVAVVENSVIMESELDADIRETADQMQQQGIDPPPSDILAKQVLERIILTKIQIQLAEQTGIRVDDETLNRTINNIAKDNKASNLDEFINMLKKDNINYEQFREDIRNKITILRLRQRQIDNQISITNKEIENALMNKESQGNTETEYLIEHILVPFPENMTAEQEEEVRLIAENALEDLRVGQSFRDIASNSSDEYEIIKASNLGWRKKTEVPTLFENYIGTIDKGELSELIKSPSGFHIIKLADVHSGERYLIMQTKARHILIRLNEITIVNDAKIKLEQLKKRIENGDDFEKLAKTHSDDIISAAEGGDLGWSSPGKLVPEFENVMNKLKINEISEPFETQFGWHLIQVLERREQDDTENAIRRRVFNDIRQKKSEELYQNWLRHIRDQAYVEYR